MEEQLISFETAKLAKEKGLTYDYVGQSFRPSGEFTCGRNDEAFYPAPTQSVLQKWLRDVHNIHIEIELASDEELDILIPYVYQWDFYKNGFITINREFYNSYEEALEVSLFEALKSIN